MCSLVRYANTWVEICIFLYWASPLQAKKVKLACLKGLAHEIDFKNFDKSFQNSLKVLSSEMDPVEIRLIR